ncbi:phage shock protein operon transcriptional activator [Aestuariispira insulae]|uniref:Psp operon transcriptional activator n=1 Tax=Aestuariispira insulae TaxID=1461337 RepID=A0A3D9HWB4_9PROT|nr:phage shock protein operon transcriptional activator [Aestuariispira insulae]RED53803.1 psp operon transcriptional activator [Aestuariispira insulae]
MAHSQNIIGEDPVFLQMLEQISSLAPLNKPTLVIGERGSGKEMIAERLHFLSARWQAPVIKVNCAALTSSLLDTELFGHEAGAFTGAERRHRGRFERADGGTLILDEIATAAPETQDKILRVLEYGEFERVGGSETLSVDVRVVGVTNVDLPALARQGKFREDLLDRLAFDVVNVPPLRARPLDIMLLADLFARDMSRELDHPHFSGFTKQAELALTAHNWPGNVRELKNVIERSVHRHRDPDNPLDSLIFDAFVCPWRISQPSPEAPPSSGKTPLPPSFHQAVADFEKDILETSLRKCRHNQTEAARQLDLSYHQFRRLLKKHAISG